VVKLVSGGGPRQAVAGLVIVAAVALAGCTNLKPGDPNIPGSARPTTTQPTGIPLPVICNCPAVITGEKTVPGPGPCHCPVPAPTVG
jgi:hypothetical protein